jgi:hypothetical protein
VVLAAQVKSDSELTQLKERESNASSDHEIHDRIVRTIMRPSKVKAHITVRCIFIFYENNGNIFFTLK